LLNGKRLILGAGDGFRPNRKTQSLTSKQMNRCPGKRKPIY
jgi:hypothetical protein